MVLEPDAEAAKNRGEENSTGGRSLHSDTKSVTHVKDATRHRSVNWGLGFTSPSPLWLPGNRC